VKDATLLELATTWELQAETGGDGLNKLQPSARETLRACADTLRMLIDTTHPQAEAEARPVGEPDSVVVGDLWREYEKTDEFRRALVWASHDDQEGALFVAFRAGLLARQPLPAAPREVAGWKFAPAGDAIKVTDPSGLSWWVCDGMPQERPHSLGIFLHPLFATLAAAAPQEGTT
jgi:hypothetical protein